MIMNFKWPQEDKTYTGLMAMCLLNEHKDKCKKHQVYWSLCVLDADKEFHSFADFCSTAVTSFANVRTRA